METSPLPPSSSIPVEIVSEEEMAFIEAALALASRPPIPAAAAVAAAKSRAPILSALNPCRRNPRSLHSAPPPPTGTDIEEAAWPSPRRSLLHQFRPHRGLMVSDITNTEWCEKRTELVLRHGTPRRTKAMIAGSDRHSELEKEVIEKVEIQIKSVEESWAVKFMNFIVRTNQLLFEGLTRELLVIGVVKGIWITGVIDELRMPIDNACLYPFLVDTKTRNTATLPSEAQKRNSRLQMMCYKYLWDNLVTGSFPTDHFFDHFNLESQYILSKDVKEYSTSLGFRAKTFGDVVKHFTEACSLLSPSQDQLLLRYELQLDHSLLEEYHFAHDAGWFETRIQECFQFWRGERGARFVPDSEDWKCKNCDIKSKCPKMTQPK